MKDKVLKYAILLLESQASDQAKKMGLQSAGFGRWKDKSGKVTHKSSDGKLVKVGSSKTSMKKFHGGDPERPSAPKKKGPSAIDRLKKANAKAAEKSAKAYQNQWNWTMDQVKKFQAAGNKEKADEYLKWLKDNPDHKERWAAYEKEKGQETQGQAPVSKSPREVAKDVVKNWQKITGTSRRQMNQEGGFPDSVLDYAEKNGVSEQDFQDAWDEIQPQ